MFTKPVGLTIAVRPTLGAAASRQTLQMNLSSFGSSLVGVLPLGGQGGFGGDGCAAVVGPVRVGVIQSVTL